LLLKYLVKKTHCLVPNLLYEVRFFMALPFKILEKTLKKCCKHLLFVLKNLWKSDFTYLIIDEITQTIDFLIEFAKLNSFIAFFCFFENIQRPLDSWKFRGLCDGFYWVILSSVLTDLRCDSVNDWRVINDMELLWMGLPPIWYELLLINLVILR
jgi:hypothetical protein